MTIRPVDLPVFKAEVLNELSSFSPPAPLPGDAGDLPAFLKETLVEAGGESEIFHVSGAMTQLALAAADSLPDFTLTAEDLVAPSGLMYFEEPIAAFDGGEKGIGGEVAAGRIDGVLWATGGGLCALAYLTDTAKEGAGSVRESGSRLKPHAVAFAILGTEERGRTGEPPQRIQEVLKATWLLMRQPLCTESSPAPDRPARRRMKKAGVAEQPVRVLELRRPRHSGPSGESDREYHHQWIVRGHWRQQWFPKREVHRPVWIAPHIKGPEGAPMLGGEKVHTWKR